MNPLDEQIQKLIAAGATDDDILLFIEQNKAAPAQDGSLSRFVKGAKQGAKNELLKMSSALRDLAPEGYNNNLDPRRAATKAPVERMLGPATNVDYGTAGKVGEFAGTIAADLPLNVAAGASGLANLGKAAVTKALGPASTKAGAFLKGAAAGLPGQIASGVATTAIVDPEQVATAKGVAKVAALSTLGSLFDGAFGVKAFNAMEPPKTGVQSFVEEVLTAPPGTAAGVKTKIDNFLQDFDRISSADPTPVRKVIDPNAEVRTPSKTPIEIAGTRGTRSWEPKRKVVPNDTDVQGYAEEILADLNQRQKITSSVIRIIKGVEKGFHSEDTLGQLPKLQEDFDKLTEKIAIDLGRIGKSAEDVRNLVQGGVKGGPRTVINIRGQQEPNMKNPTSAGSTIPSGEKFKVSESRLRPGSGTQSPYAYVPPEQSIDPLAPILAPKKLPTPPAWLDADEQKIYNQLDIGNENAAAALREERYLLDSPMKRLDYKATDFLRPVKEASAKAYDYASKFLRVNMRAQAAIDDALYIPNGDGTYTRGAEGLVPIARMLGGDSEHMLRFNMYAQARQALSGVETPFDITSATNIVNKYKSDFPDIVKAYEQGHKPLVGSMLEAMRKYELVTEEQFRKLSEATDYVPLTRSAFGENFASTSFIKGRKNPGSDKLVGDYWSTMMSNVRGLVRAGERANVLRELVRARQGNEGLAGAIDIIPYVKPEGFDEMVAKLPKDTPEALKQALADAYVVPQRGDVFPLLVDGKRVSVKLNPELAASLDMMQFRGPKTYNPENVGALEKILARPAETLARVEKAATGVYSVYRDLFGFGLPLDAIETAINATARGYKFNPLVDPIKGFMALYRNDPAIRDIAGHAGLLGFRYANPMAEGVTKSTDDIVRLAKNQGLKLRMMDMKSALSEFTGNLSNASRAGLALANADRSMPEMATLYNEIIGDPAKTGAQLAAMARFTGFMNYPMQATKAQMKALAESPKNLGFFAARAGGMLVAPTIAAWYLGKDDERISELSKDPAGRNYIFLPNPFNPDEPYAIQKPQGPAGALFVTLPQMLMEELQNSGNTQVLEQTGKAAIQAIMPNPMPLTMNMMLGVATGQTLDFRGAVDGQLTRSVVPQGRQGMLPEDAAAAGASQTSQLLAQLSGVDAGKWERVMRTFMIGTSYNMFREGEDLLTADNPNEYKPMNPMTLVPGVRKVDASNAGNRYISEFYEKFNEAGKTLKSMNAAVNNGQPEKAAGIFNTRMDTVQDAMKLAAQKTILDELNKQITTTKYNEFLSGEQKTERVRELQADRVKYAKRFLGVEK